MLKNYLKIALRSLLKQKAYSVINILGLSVGIGSALLIALFVQYEFSYDTFFSESDQIYKIALERKYPNHSTFYAVVPHSYSEAITQDIPEVKQVTRIGIQNNVQVSYKTPGGDEKSFEEKFIAAADSNFFLVFRVPFTKGDPEKALQKPNDLVITESTARKYFGDDDPLGKSMDFFGTSFTVTGVCKDLPENTHLKFDMVVNIFFTNGGVSFFRRENYTGFSTHMYIELNPGVDPQVVESKIPALVDRYAAAAIERNLGKSWEDYKKEGNGYRYFLQPLTSVHLDPTNIEAKMEPGGNLSFIYFLISVAALLVVIACINFMNLATAKSAERAREVGVRKTMGSEKSQLILQFLAESTLLSVLATGMAILLMELVLPSFNQLTEKHLELYFGIPLLFGLIFLSLFIGFLAGAYPAFVLSGFNPVMVMKGNFTSSKKGIWLRNGLVIFQFTISIILIVGTLVVQQQMSYMQNKSLGFDKEQMLVVQRAFTLRGEKAKSFLEEVRQLPQVTAAAGSAAMPGDNNFFGAFFQPEGSSEILTTKSMVVADDLAETLGLQLTEGKWFSNVTNDSMNLLVNEAAVKAMDLKDPVGKKLFNVQQRPDGNVTVPFTIIGVVKDFHFQSLRDQITPLVIQSTESFGGNFVYVMARIKPGEYSSAVAAVESLWKKFNPEETFRFVFLDENFDSLYKSEQQAGKLFLIFTGLAIFVACMGLFGLSAYTAQLRTKEIGIRKVLGASVTGVVMLLAKDFSRMVLISFTIAAPIAWYFMRQWLDGFAYKIDLSVTTFMIAGALTFLIAAITVSFQTVKSAIINPVKSLKSE